MDETTLKIAVAGFLHDIGKFADSLVFKMSARELDEKRSIFLSDKKQGSYNHSIYTSEFISKYKDCLPDKFSDAQWGEGREGVEILAASHHSPGSPLQEIITQADWMSSGMDRKKSEDKDKTIPADFRKTRMVSILESLDYQNPGGNYTKKQYRYALPLRPVKSHTIFPALKSEVIPDDQGKACDEYRALFKSFEEELKKIMHKDHPQLWFEHFDSLVRKYTSMIPSARAGEVVPDVSLYDHLRTTSGIAAAMYLYHKDNGTLTSKAINEKESKKFILISGDFHGIQEFIFSGYGDVRKSRSKLFRGRSFYVSLLSEIAADLICRKAGLPHTSVLLAAGGKFTLIAPNTDFMNQIVIEAEREISDWFVEKTYGQAGISFSTTPASWNDFSSDQFIRLFDDVNKDLLAKKLTRINLGSSGGVVENYFDGQDLRICRFCGKRPGHYKDRNTDDEICGICGDHKYIGEKIVQGKNIAVYYSGSGQGSAGALKENIFGLYNLQFYDDGEDEDQKGLVKYFRTQDRENLGFSCAVKSISGYVPRYGDEDYLDSVVFEEGGSVKPGELKLFEDIAREALSKSDSEDGFRGLEALGVLKADVDNLGLLMSCGLDEKVYSISRTASLSRQLDNFFTVFLPEFLENNFPEVYTVFAGGDDLFLIGPWNMIYDLSIQLKEAFAEYVCRNPRVTFSAGISLCKPNTPVDALAEEAEELLESSKDRGRDRLTVFGETIQWSSIEDLGKIEHKLKTLLEKNIISSSMMYKLNTFSDLAQTEKQIGTSKKSTSDKLKALKWKSLFFYSLARNLTPAGDRNEKERVIEEITREMVTWLEMYGSGFRIPLWKLLYSIRKK